MAMPAAATVMLLAAAAPVSAMAVASIDMPVEPTAAALMDDFRTLYKLCGQQCKRAALHAGRKCGHGLSFFTIRACWPAVLSNGVREPISFGVERRAIVPVLRRLTSVFAAFRPAELLLRRSEPAYLAASYSGCT